MDYKQKSIKPWFETKYKEPINWAEQFSCLFHQEIYELVIPNHTGLAYFIKGLFAECIF